MNKYWALIATMLVAFGFAYTLPVTIRNPTTSNLVVSGILGVIVLLGIYVYYKLNLDKRPVTQKVGDQEFTPVED